MHSSTLDGFLRTCSTAIVVLMFLLAGGSEMRAARYFDDFSGGTGAWQSGPAWFADGTGAAADLVVDTPGDEFAWNNVVVLGYSWSMEMEFSFEDLYNDDNWTGTAGFALADQQGHLIYLADVIFSEDAWVYPGMGYYTDAWHNTLEPNEWHPGAESTITLRLERPPGSDRLKFVVTCPNGFRREYTSLPVPAPILDQATKMGLRGFKSRVRFHQIEVVTPLPPVVELALHPGLTIRGEPGSRFRVDFTSDLESGEWHTLTNLTLTGSSQVWFDLTATHATRRFYRTVQE